MTGPHPIFEPHLGEIEREQERKKFQNRFMLDMLRKEMGATGQEPPPPEALPPGIVGPIEPIPPSPLQRGLTFGMEQLRRLNLPTDVMTEAFRAFGVPFSSDVQFTNRFAVPSQAAPTPGSQVIANDPIAENSKQVVDDILAGRVSIADGAGALRENFEKRSFVEQLASPNLLDIPVPAGFAVKAGLDILQGIGLNKRLLNEVAQDAAKTTKTQVILSDLAEGRITLSEAVGSLAEEFPDLRIVAGGADDIDPKLAAIQKINAAPPSTLESAIRLAAKDLFEIEGSKGKGFIVYYKAKGPFANIQKGLRSLGSRATSQGGLTTLEGAEEFARVFGIRNGLQQQEPAVVDALMRTGKFRSASTVESVSDISRTIDEVTDASSLTKAKQTTPTFTFDDPVLDKMHRGWREVPAKDITSLSDNLTTANRWFQTELVDKFAFANEVTGGARKWWKGRFGGTLPTDFDAELHFSLLSGRPSAGARMALDVVDEVKVKIGGLDEDLVNDYLKMRHQLDVVNQHPTRKVSGFGDAAQLQEKFNLFQEKLGPEALGKVEDAAGSVRDFYKNAMERMVDSGLVPRDLADTLATQYPWYNPIRYVDSDLARAVDGGTSKASNTRSGIRFLSEIGSKMPTEPALTVLFQAAPQIETLIARNNAARAFIRAMAVNPEWQGSLRRMTSKELVRPVAETDAGTIFRPRQGEIPGTISYMNEGKRVVYEVPREAEALAKAGAMLPGNGFMTAMQYVNALPRAAMVTFHPVFMGAQFLLDAMTVAITHGVLPHRTAATLLKNLWRFGRTNEDIAEMVRAGGDVGGFWGRTASDQLKRSKTTGDLAIVNQNGWKELLNPKKVFPTIRDIGHQIELAPRVAVFNKALERGASKEVAALLARRATVDFDRIGNSMRYLNAMYLFLNPAVQGALIPYRALRNPATRKYSLMGMSGYMGAHLAAYMWNRQFPEYKDVPLHDKYGSFHVLLPSTEVDERGNTVPHILKFPPNVREFSAVSGPMLLLLGKLDGTAPETFGQWAEAMIDQISPLGPVSSSGLVPTQLGATLMDTVRNYDSFRSREIVPIELEGKKPAEQFDKNTSLLARRVGEYLDVSPMKIDFWLRQGVFYEVIIGADAAIRAAEGGDPVVDGLVAQIQDIQLSQNPEDVPRLRRAFLNDLSIEQRKQVEDKLNEPEPRIPLVSAAVDRFYRRSGGNMYAAGLAIAEAETGLSSDQTRKVGSLLSATSDEIDMMKSANDQAFMNGDIGRAAWLSTNQDYNGIYSNALIALKPQFPRAAQLQDDREAYTKYLDILNTLGGSEADRRTKGQILMAGLRAIPLGQLAVGVEDWDTFFALRDEYVESLSEADQELLQEELDASRSPLEKERDRDFEDMKDYFTTGSRLLHTDAQKDLYKEYRTILRTKGSEEAKKFASRPSNNDAPFIFTSTGAPMTFEDYISRGIRATRESLRLEDSLLDALLRKWQRTESYKHPLNLADEARGFSPEQIAAEARRNPR